jgi:hypothetical protein
MGCDDDQIYLLRCCKLNDFVRWRAHDHLASDLDLSCVNLWQYLCEIKMDLAFQFGKEHRRPSWRYEP